jgi:murein L,D-transpeptidase YcbB/YkuD
LGLMDPVLQKISKKEVTERIKVAQRMFNLLADGILRETIRDEMNIPLKYRIEELKMALNTIRWFGATTTSSTIVIVNIPSANLLVYENGKVILESRVIVGKKSTPTSTLSSTITEVILYPYWVVPRKIAINELLPIIKRDIGYLDKNAIEVFNLQGKLMNPYRINWNSLSASYFPYVLRQSTGCDNSLGLVKLNFYNPFTTYLHDTPWKFLFSFNKRYFSHGCIRVEKAIELARVVLKDNQQAIDSVTEKGCLKDQLPISIQPSKAMPVFVLYQTAWVDSSATVSFHEDVYQRLRYLRPASTVRNKSLAAK